MASRSLTEVFILMRNNAFQNKHLFSDQIHDDRMALVTNDVEAGSMAYRNSRLPPGWTDKVEEVNYEITKIKGRVKELGILHERHLTRPTLDDMQDEEAEIEAITADITRMLERCRRLVNGISSHSHSGSSRDQQVAKNVTSALARSLQETTTSFRSSQNVYMQRLKSLRERNKSLFDTDMSAISSGTMLDDEDDEEDIMFTRGGKGQMQAVAQNSKLVEHREREIEQIAISINDLNIIFRELADMVVDQGTILDQIDYNVDQAATSVERGLGQLQKAEKYQKKNRKMLIILVLAAIVILLLIILIAVKSR